MSGYDAQEDRSSWVVPPHPPPPSLWKQIKCRVLHRAKSWDVSYETWRREDGCEHAIYTCRQCGNWFSRPYSGMALALRTWTTNPFSK